jgi:hypothetical protein
MNKQMGQNRSAHADQLLEVDGRSVLGRAVIECLGSERRGLLGRMDVVPEVVLPRSAQSVAFGAQAASAPSRPPPQHASATSVNPDARGWAKVFAMRPKLSARE